MVIDEDIVTAEAIEVMDSCEGQIKPTDKEPELQINEAPAMDVNTKFDREQEKGKGDNQELNKVVVDENDGKTADESSGNKQSVKVEEKMETNDQENNDKVDEVTDPEKVENKGTEDSNLEDKTEQTVDDKSSITEIGEVKVFGKSASYDNEGKTGKDLDIKESKSVSFGSETKESSPGESKSDIIVDHGSTSSSAQKGDSQTSLNKSGSYGFTVTGVDTESNQDEEEKFSNRKVGNNDSLINVNPVVKFDSKFDPSEKSAKQAEQAKNDETAVEKDIPVAVSSLKAGSGLETASYTEMKVGSAVLPIVLESSTLSEGSVDSDIAVISLDTPEENPIALKKASEASVITIDPLPIKTPVTSAPILVLDTPLPSSFSSLENMALISTASSTADSTNAANLSSLTSRTNSIILSLSKTSVSDTCDESVVEKSDGNVISAAKGGSPIENLLSVTSVSSASALCAPTITAPLDSSASNEQGTLENVTNIHTSSVSNSSIVQHSALSASASVLSTSLSVSVSASAISPTLRNILTSPMSSMDTLTVPLSSSTHSPTVLGGAITSTVSLAASTKLPVLATRPSVAPSPSPSSRSPVRKDHGYSKTYRDIPNSPRGQGDSQTGSLILQESQCGGTLVEISMDTDDKRKGQKRKRISCTTEELMMYGKRRSARVCYFPMFPLIISRYWQ